MKIFISHSHVDRWAAGKIAEDLESRGHETFLDAKNIETGESISDSVQGHLRDCDEFLLLLSPSSVSSEWVLIELGGALALNKRVAPILLHVGPNLLPSIINARLTRDINEVERYYDELERRQHSTRKEPVPSALRRAQPTPRFEVREGDRVMLPKTIPTGAQDTGPGWNPEMTEQLGKEAIVIAVREDDEPEPTLRLDVDGGEWLWMSSWITLLEPRHEED